jgi:hypothetical protein
MNSVTVRGVTECYGVVCFQMPDTDWYIEIDNSMGLNMSLIEGFSETCFAAEGNQSIQGRDVTETMVFSKSEFDAILTRVLECLDSFHRPESEWTPDDIAYEMYGPRASDRIREIVAAWRNQEQRIRSFYQGRAAKVIQRRFRKAISDPEYSLCQKRLLREYCELLS